MVEAATQSSSDDYTMEKFSVCEDAESECLIDTRVRAKPKLRVILGVLLYECLEDALCRDNVFQIWLNRDNYLLYWSTAAHRVKPATIDNGLIIGE